ncbi:ABC transporter ATP-binding protein [Salibacterium halotolerans]|uniref:Carnitine transport ATP-binding protein OpuCA n=1 Tax=Salibacterium halotolerans TaxID=1884432 RepID=A0A1I5W0V3_9BACI|nr:ATP-binding cassette domain-containing protein [Salibacterium halotolerans]SFQ13237.1 iron(III) transport system ATP-binding protein [Salibacterium halotolerans]
MKHLTVQNITKNFKSFTALNDLTFSIDKGEFICLLGPSGCGKTTLLRIIAGLEKPNQGAVLMNDKQITHLPPAQRNFGIVFQSYALFPNLTAAQNTAYGLDTSMSKKERREKALDTLKLVNLEHIADSYPLQLSGGQQQRVALARALAMSPDFLLLDEPLSALDAKVRLQLRNEMKKLQRQLGITTIMVTHDQEEALSMADRLVVMNDSLIEQTGTPQEVYDHPATAFTADFIGTANFIGDQIVPQTKREAAVIRPEHVQISKHPVVHSLPAHIEHMEFRGRTYRLMLQQSEKDSIIYADIEADEFKRHPYSVGEAVYAGIQKEKLIHFENRALPTSCKMPVLSQEANREYNFAKPL